MLLDSYFQVTGGYRIQMINERSALIVYWIKIMNEVIKFSVPSRISTLNRPIGQMISSLDGQSNSVDALQIVLSELRAEMNKMETNFNRLSSAFN
jgi:hypothetical protein